MDVRCVVDVYFVVDDCQPCHRGVIFSQCRVTLLIVLQFGMGLLGVHHCGHCITRVGFYSMFITVATVSLGFYNMVFITVHTVSQQWGFTVS